MGRKMNKVVEKDSLWWRTCGKCNPSVGLLLLSKKIYFVLWSESFWPQCLSCHYPWPSWNNLLRITGAKLNMSLGTDHDVWNRADFSKVFLGRWHLLHRAEQGFVGSDRLTDGIFFFSCWLSCVYLSERSNVERSVWPQEGGGSQAWRMCFECQSSLMSSLSYPQVALWVQTSAAEWAPVLVRVMYSIFTIRVYVCCLNRQTEPLGLIQSFLVLG